MQIQEGKYTVETFAKERNLTRQSAINLLSKLRKQGHVSTDRSGKRIYTLTRLPKRPTNGFYSVVNRYSPEKLHPAFEHHVYGRYSIERAIIDGLKINDIRTRQATMHLFRHVNSWTELFALAKKHRMTEKVKELYREARTKTKTKTMPKRYR